jgi:serine/threonine protein kinase
LAAGGIGYSDTTADFNNQNDNDNSSSRRSNSNSSNNNYVVYGHTSNNVVSIHQYCGYTLIVPMGLTSLDEYVSNYKLHHREREYMDAKEMYQLGHQAANGLYQSHLYKNGRATVAHSDVKPSQFLLFHSGVSSLPDAKTTTKMTEEGNSNTPLDLKTTKDKSTAQLPILKLNDFNRCRLLSHDAQNNNTCPFQMCGIQHKGSTYRSPEEYMDCANQDDSIDVYSLGGVFYFILSDGLDPYEGLEYDIAVGRILKGDLPMLPLDGDDLKKKERSGHPAFVALKDIMLRCWRFEPKDRPSSLEVVRMFEEQAESVLR